MHRYRSLVALAAFAARALVPAPAFVTHHHQDGERAHVHAEDLLGDRADHPHRGHVHVHGPAGPGPELEATDPADGLHSHCQHPFQRTARPTPPAVPGGGVVVTPLARSTPAPPAPLPPHTRC